MTDLVFGGAWLVVLAIGIGVVVLLAEAGLATTYARDLLHVGASVWVLGWPFWDSWFVPQTIVLLAFVMTLLAPRRIVQAVSGGDEQWRSVVWYTGVFGVFTMLAAVDPVPAAIALIALGLGDGLGGLVGRRFGRITYRVPFGKTKSFEGTAVVALCSLVGVGLVGAWFGVSISLGAALLVASVAALVEALTPRGLDNLTVPIAAWIAAAGVT